MSQEHTGHNAFGAAIPEVKDILADQKIHGTIQAMCKEVFTYLGLPDERSDTLIKEFLDLARSYGTINEYEQTAHMLFEREGITQAIPKKLLDRARIMYDQVKSHLVRGSVLDLGCGDARLAQFLAQDGFELHLADIYKHPNVDTTGLPFTPIAERSTLPFAENQFDNTLLLTVLHHSEDPVYVLREAYRVTRANGNVIVIDSVDGVNGLELSPAEHARAARFLALSADEQRNINIFFCHLYNRVIHYAQDPAKKVQVPFNFNTPDAWKTIFEEQGYEQKQVIHLGIDQPVVPDYHTLHILTVKK